MLCLFPLSSKYVKKCYWHIIQDHSMTKKVWKRNVLKASSLSESNNTLQYSPAEDIHEWASNETNTALLMCGMHFRYSGSRITQLFSTMTLTTFANTLSHKWPHSGTTVLCTGVQNLAVLYNKQVLHAHLITTKQELANHALYNIIQWAKCHMCQEGTQGDFYYCCSILR
jgi:hypothetical protein